MKFKVLLVISYCFLIVDIAFAADQMARSCSQPDVQSALNTCVNGGGGTVHIPAGECTWTTGLTTASSSIFYLEGAGETSTIITYTGSGTAIYFRAQNQGFRGMSHFTLYGPNNGSGTGFYVGVYGHPELYIHDLTVGKFNSAGRVIGYHGVISRVTFSAPGPNVNPYGVRVEGIDTDGWPIVGGKVVQTFGSREALYFEDCVWAPGYGHATSGFCNGKYVVRHSSRTGAVGAGGLDMHQASYQQCYTSGDRWADPKNGSYQLEAYDNSLGGSGKGSGYGIYHRSGAAIITNNTFHDLEVGALLVLEGGLNGNQCGPHCTLADDCPLDNYDNNNCSDANDGCCMRPDSVYVWNNTNTNVNTPVATAGWGSCSFCLRENHEYFRRAPTLVDDGFKFTKFTYPHPLVSGVSGEDRVPPISPSGLRIVK